MLGGWGVMRDWGIDLLEGGGRVVGGKERREGCG